MTAECIFCRIVARELPASIVYEDAATIAFLDLRQTNEGHVLVLPRTHVPTLDRLPADAFAPLMATVVAMTSAVQRCFGPDGINIWQSNGEGAAQEVPHVHFHVFPRWKNDGHFRIYPEDVANAGRDALEQLAVRLRGFVEGA